MAYEKPSTTPTQVNKAGRRLANANDSNEDRLVLRNWRAAHSYPLNALHMTLRNRAKRMDENAITAQRLKRYDSIIRKLRLKGTMDVSQMQDIGGCRAVVVNMDALRELLDVYSDRPLRHELSNSKNYVDDPKGDGYRSIHLMYRYHGRATASPWDKLRIEIQLRTQLQHAWATAVETVDIFTGQDLKFGGGQRKWKQFFSLVGGLHAIIEDTAAVPDMPNNESKLRTKIKRLESQLKVINSLQTFSLIATHIERGAGHWYVLNIDPTRRAVYGEVFQENQFDDAKARLAKLEDEAENTQMQPVMVSVQNIAELERAYPNYFADTKHFVSVLKDFLYDPT